MKLNLITLAMFVMAVIWTCLHAPSVQWTAVRIAGAAIAGVSIALLIVARLQLGASFSVRAKAKKLLTTGLYSRIRNPIYVFGELLLIGVSMLVERWEILLLMAALVPMQVVRARKEARVLAAAFGEEYARYKARTWF